MDEHEAVARMRAADPAAHAEPDAERLAHRTAVHRGDELAARRERRAPRWAAVAAVTAGALVVGGAGFGLGRGTADSPVQADGAATTAESEGLGSPEIMMGEERADGGMATDMAFAPGYGGRTTFTAQGVSDQAGTAPAWAFDGASTLNAETAARVADLFGAEGEPRQEGGWVVGPVDGSGPSLQIGNDGAATVWFYDPALDALVSGSSSPVPLPEPAGPVDDGEPGEGGGTTGSSGAADSPAVRTLPAPAAPQEDGTDAVEPEGQAPDGAAGVLYETLAALGIDADSAEYETQEHWSGAAVDSVMAYQLAGGLRTGMSWSAEIVDGEVYTFGGPLAPLVELGEYDVVSPAEAVARLGDPRFGGAEVWREDMVSIMPADPERDWNAPPGPPPAAGSSIPWPVTDVTITAAEPALIDHWTADGATLLLPGYELSDAQGRTWRVLAVADHHLAF